MRKRSGASPDFQSLLAFAHLLADRSAQVTLPFFRKRIAIANKASGDAFDPVTTADCKAEKVIKRLVRDTFPDHGLEGEEFGHHQKKAEYRWVIDPIDGTRAFIMGTPLWGTLIGLVHNGTPVLGIMDQPFTGERFWSAEYAAFARVRDGTAKKLKTRVCPRLEDAIFTTTHPDLFERGFEASAFSKLKARTRMTRYGGDCYSYCLLAAGFVDLVVETGLKPHDVTALIPIIERSGGRMTAWDGSPAIGGGRIVAAGDPKLHETVLRILAH